MIFYGYLALLLLTIHIISSTPLPSMPRHSLPLNSQMCVAYGAKAPSLFTSPFTLYIDSIRKCAVQETQ